MTNAINIVPQIDACTVRREGQRILLIRNGQVILDMPPDAAIAIFSAGIAKAREAEEEQPAVAEKVTLDAALLLRKGIPLGLSRHPKILRDIRKEAQSNRDLRRYLPGGIQSREQFGTPGVFHGAPLILPTKG